MFRVASSPLRSTLVATLGVLVCVSCTPAPLTQLVVDVEIDPAILARFTSVDITITSPSGTTTTESFAPGAVATPSLGLVHHDGALGPIRIEARGHGTAAVDRVITSFLEGQTRLVVLVLGDTCAPACCATQRCAMGQCVDATVAADSLPTFDGTIPQIDGGTPDAYVVDGLDCIFSWQCPTLDDRCVSDETGHGHCIHDPTVTGGDPCARDTDCFSGSCDPSTDRCRYACGDNSDCDTGMFCVATRAARSDGACFAMAPCDTCDAALQLTVDGVTPFCTPSHVCLTTMSCMVDGQECTWSGATQPFGDVGWCVPVLAGHPACDASEMALVDTNGTAYCTYFAMCQIGGTPCSSGQCIAGTQFGFPAERVAHGESICARAR